LRASDHPDGTKTGPPDETALRDLQRHCDELFAIERDTLNATVEFVLSAFVIDLFTNVYSDTHYTPALEHARLQLTSELPEVLSSVSDALTRNDRSAAVEAIGRMFVGYAGILRRLNDLEERSYAKT
jgi:hypothetical protein